MRRVLCVNLTAVDEQFLWNVCIAGTSSIESPSVNMNEAGFYDVAYSLVEIACMPAQTIIKFGGESGANAANKQDSPVSRLIFYRENSPNPRRVFYNTISHT